MYKYLILASVHVPGSRTLSILTDRTDSVVLTNTHPYRAKVGIV